MLLGGCNEQKVTTQTATALEPKPQAPCKTEVTLNEKSEVISKIQTAPVTHRTLAFIVEATGQLQANANAVTRISAPVSGKIATISASVGESVRTGQNLATLTSQEIGALVTDLFRSENEISSDVSRDISDVDAEIKQAKAEMGLCQKQYDRAKLLLEEKISPISTVEALQTDLEKHRLTISALEEKKNRVTRVGQEKKRLTRLAVEQKLSLLGMPRATINSVLNGRQVMNVIEIDAPQSGFVLERNVNLGELVDPARTLFVVDDIDTLWLMADIFEQDVEYVSTGQPIDFTVDSFPNQKFHGKLDFVAGTINPETRTLAVRAVIQNPTQKLKPKMFARMRILAGNHNVLAIPKSAVQDAGSERVVYVPTGKFKYEERVVQLGEESGDYVEVVKGLSPGDTVVTAGSFSLRSQTLKESR